MLTSIVINYLVDINYLADISIGQSFRISLKITKPPEGKQTQSKGATHALVTVPNQGEQSGSAGNVLLQGCIGRGKAEITENLPRFIKQFGVSCVS